MYKRSQKTIIIFIMMLQLFVWFMQPLNAYSSEKTFETIRVGYMPDDTYFYKTDNNEFHGLYAEYIYKIAQYTGWKYEFVPGSQEYLLDLLANGELDMLLNINYTPERRAVCYFPDYPITMQQLCCVVHPDDMSFPNSDLRNLKGKKVGTITDTYSETVLLKLIDDKRLRCTYTPYSSYNNLMYAFAAGAVDAIVINISDVDDSQKVLSILDIGESYLAVSKLRPDILQALNNTLKEIYVEYPNYNSDLYKKFVDVDGKNYALSSEALSYIAAAPVIKVAYMNDNAPFEYYDKEEDTFNGIAGAYLSAISQLSGLEFEYIPVETYQDALKMVQNGESDLISSIYSNNVYAYSRSLKMTDTYYNIVLSLIRKNDISLNLHEPTEISLVNNTVGIDSYLSNLYSTMSFKYYDSVEECIASVRSGETSAAILPSELSSIFLQQHYYSDIVTSSGLQLSMPISIGIRDDMPQVLLNVLNQTLKSIPASEKETIKLENMVQTTYSVSLLSILTANLVPLLIIILCFAILIVSIIVLSNKIRYERVLTVSKTDQLTGILNKISAEKRIKQYLSTAPPEICALYILDVDHFKSVNDTFGHKTGDIIIRDTAQLVKNNFTEHDIIGRMGGDEFIVLQTQCRSQSEIKATADKLLNALNRIYYVSENETCKLTASIGIMIYNNGNYTYDELVEETDKLLYEVKASGKNNYKIST